MKVNRKVEEERGKLTSFRTKTRAFSKKPPLLSNKAQDFSHYSSRRENPEAGRKNLGNRERESGKIFWRSRERLRNGREKGESVKWSGMECNYGSTRLVNLETHHYT